MMITRPMLFHGGILFCSVLMAFRVEGFTSIVSTTTTTTRILPTTTSRTPQLHATTTVAPNNNNNDVEAPGCGFVKSAVLDAWNAASANEYADMFGFAKSEAGFYGLVEAMKKAQIAMGLRGVPFVLRRNEIEAIVGGGGDDDDDDDILFQGFFTMKDLERAVEDDFLDAARGSTDNRKGWKVRNEMK
jgi:hypothetical protein